MLGQRRNKKRNEKNALRVRKSVTIYPVVWDEAKWSINCSKNKREGLTNSFYKTRVIPDAKQSQGIK